MMFGFVLMIGLALGMALAALTFAVGGAALALGGLVCVTSAVGAVVSISARISA